MAKKGGKQKQLTRRRTAKSAFYAITLEGGLIQPDVFAAIAVGQADEQAEPDYGLDPKEQLRDVVQTKFTLAQSLYARLLGSDKGSAATRRFTTGLMTQVFEFTDLREAAPVRIGERTFLIGHQALGGRVPTVLAPYGKLEEAITAFGDGSRKRSAAQLLQEYLNATDTALWGVACDGARLRICRDSAALTRPAFIEADLTRIFDADAPLIADFAALWLLVHASRFGRTGAEPSDCPLERRREEGRKQGATARERLRVGVESTLLALGRGFLEHPANAVLKAELKDGRLSPQDFLQALLRLVYCFIFVFTAEDRDVLHLPPPEDKGSFDAWRAAKSLYQRGYAFARLRDRAAKRAFRDRHSDGWEGTQIVFTALARGERRLGLPALGGLFGPNGARELGDCALANMRLYEALFHLTWLSTESGLERVNWRDMQTEELGSVYESLLELSPRLGGPEAFEFVDVLGNERKTTASYYTPDSLVQALLDETLDPLLAETIRGKQPKEAAKALLSLRILDPACGSGHFLLAAARRIAAKVAELTSPGAPTLADFRHWLRECARRCLFGVDRNPMAVDLAKVALWIETVEPGKPLTFFDAHIRCGDALFGIYDLAELRKGIPDDAYKPLTGDNKTAAREWGKRNQAEREARAKGEFAMTEPPRAILDAVVALETGGEDALTDVEAKSCIFRALLVGPELYALQVACDLYMAAYLLPKTAPPGRHAGETQRFVPTSRDVWDRLSGRQIAGQVEARAVDVARAARTFHWPLEFPQVFFPQDSRQKGFDLAIGNPPWDRLKLQEKEFFAARAPEIVDAPNKAARQRMIDALASGPSGSPERKLFNSFLLAKRLAEAASTFARTSGEIGGRFPLTGTGDVNTYALFAELFCTSSGFAGLIVPTGIATDDSTKGFLQYITESGRLSALISFYEIRRWFTQTDDRKPFCILCLSSYCNAPVFMFGVNRIDELADERKQFSLSVSQIAAINPNTRTLPIFRSKADAELTRQIYARLPVLIDERNGTSGNLWNIDFLRMFDMSGDSGLFCTARKLEAAGAARNGAGWQAPEKASALNVTPGYYAPLYEAKMVHHYDPRWATYEVSRGANLDDLDPRLITEAEKSDPGFHAAPRYFVPEIEIAARLQNKGWNRGWLMGWRDISLAAVERTVISTAFPRAGAGHKLPVFFCDRDARHMAAICAVWSSLAFDYSARQKFGATSLTYSYLKQFPMPPPSAFSVSDFDFIASRVLELTYTAYSMRPFAEDLGYDGPPFAWDRGRRAVLRAELDAKIATLFELDRDQLRYILDPEDVMGKGYPSETFRVLKKNEIAKFGEYRTARLVLDAWDRLERGEIRDLGPPVTGSSRKLQIELDVLADNTWATPPDVSRENVALFACIDVIRGFGTSNTQDVQWATILASKPALAVPFLNHDARKSWLRVVGKDAQPLPANVVRISQSQRSALDRPTADALRTLRATGAIVENLDSGILSPGPNLPASSGQEWMTGRAAIAVDIVQRIDQGIAARTIADFLRSVEDGSASRAIS